MQDKHTWLWAQHKSSFVKIDCYKWSITLYDYTTKNKMEHLWKVGLSQFDGDKWGLKCGGITSIHYMFYDGQLLHIIRHDFVTVILYDMIL